MTADADLIHAVRQSLFERGPYISEKEAQRVIADVGRQLAEKIESELSDATAHYRAANSDRAGSDQTVAYWSGREDALRDISVDVREWTGASHLPEDHR